MCRIDKLIEEPDDVKFKTIEETCNILDNMRKPVTRKDRKVGIYPYYGANGILDYVDDYIFDGTFILMGEDGSVINKDKSPILTWATGKIWVNNHAHILTAKNNINLRFLYHYLQTIDVSSVVRGAPPKLNQQNLKNIRVPVPDLDVQNKITGILDSFTELIEELTTELAIRKKQYEFYRDLLLDFDNNIEYKTLGELGSFYGGLTGKSKTDFVNGNCKFISYMNVYSNLSLDINMSDKVRIKTGEKQNTIQLGDVIFTGSSENTEECGISSVLTTEPDELLYLNSFCFGYRFNDKSLFIPDFSKYLFRSNKLRKQIIKTASGVTRYNVSKRKMEKVVIPIPPLSTQKHIVSILNQFDTLCTVSLPAEIEARKKQYGYYRDRLLAFKEGIYEHI